MAAQQFSYPGEQSRQASQQQPNRIPDPTNLESGPSLVLFKGAYILPSTTYEKPQWENDAQIAARRAMAKRSSRSYAARVSRTRSRKMERLGRPTKPTLDTSFTKHKGSIPRQLFPQDDSRNIGTVRKHSWLGLGRSATGGKGLGIMKGTPQPGHQGKPFVNPSVPLQSNKEPKTADSLTPGIQAWMEISPSDGPIPIGISIPSDSIADFSSYQGSRQRSESDATLVTPSIIVTPAVAMKSMWSPDTESEYTPSIYSRATFNPYSHISDIPPVPALPANVLSSSGGNTGSEVQHARSADAPTHARNSTLDSAGTAFEEDYDTKRRDRITSTGTVFEEDETPLQPKNIQTTGLSLDTAAVATPRSAHGWWNVITTPFEFSRTNSVWTQNGRNNERTPDIPMMPQQYAGNVRSPSTLYTSVWSATEKSPSAVGDSPVAHISFPTSRTRPMMVENLSSKHENGNSGAIVLPPTSTENDTSTGARAFPFQPSLRSANGQNQQTPPKVSTAVMDIDSVAHQITEKQPPTNVLNEHQDIYADVTNQTTKNNSPPISQPLHVHLTTSQSIHTTPTPGSYTHSSPHFPPPPGSHTSTPRAPEVSNLDLSTYSGKTDQTTPQFPPPPRFMQSSPDTSHDQYSRSSSPVSTAELKPQKKHRKVFNMADWLPFSRRNKSVKKQDKKRSRSRKLCWGCCCCMLIVILVSIIVPVVVVTTRKHNDGSKSQGAPSQWLNLTGYPPILTGVSTIAQPESVKEESGCVVTTTLWSCAVPKEDQQSISPNKPDQPNFKIEIVFQNGTVSDPSKTKIARRAANAVTAGALIRSRLLGIRAAPSASPTAPSVGDYKFLGETTDDNQTPFEGEDTPFFVNVLDPKGTTSSNLAKRANDPSNFTANIPPPVLRSDGTAAPANLLPLASGQPLRLFNRGKQDEHYGFFVFFDRSIFLKDITQNLTTGVNAADLNGGSAFNAATLRCTWSQTRFLVQIWTRSQTTKPLLQSSPSGSPSDAKLKRPGSFPYPVTVTLDRHGGAPTKKMLFCYNMEKDGTIRKSGDNKFFFFEDRGAGGSTVNPAQGPTQNITGPIDGGHGGCRCQWQNWLA